MTARVPNDQNQDTRSDTTPATTGVNTPAGYRSPEVHRLGNLDQVQLGFKGRNYDGSQRYWYYE